MGSDSIQLSLFDFEAFTSKEKKETYRDDSICVQWINYLNSENTNYQQLFKGYQYLKIMTYSYGLPFIGEIVKNFENVEVIIGSENQMRVELAELAAVQQYNTNYICKNRYLQSRIKKGDLTFYMSRGVLIHSKLYLLSSDSGKVRTIIGSANASMRAWDGSQGEIYMGSDDPDLYDYYLGLYEAYKRDCTDEFAKETKPIKGDGINFDEIPLLKKIRKTDTAIVVHEANATDFEVEYEISVKNSRDEWKERLDAGSIQRDRKHGTTIIDTKNIVLMKNYVKTQVEKKQNQTSLCPELILDYETEQMIYNGCSFNLNPEPEEIFHDIADLTAYFEGFEWFTKDTDKMKETYWKVLNYVFLSPFIPYLRAKGHQVGMLRPFPMYMLINGRTDGAKTQFLMMTEQLMFGHITAPLRETWFGNKQMVQLKNEIHGFPVVIDEISKSRWQYVDKIVKMDENLAIERNIHHPTFILISNDIKGVKGQITKRVIMFSIDNQLPKEKAASVARKITNLRNDMGNALYREYVRRMFPVVNTLARELIDRSKEDTEWIPDIFHLSSVIIRQIISEHVDIPDMFRELWYKDYMGDAVLSERALSLLRQEYEYNPTVFEIRRREDLLILDYSGCFLQARFAEKGKTFL